jgi:hypothetical protein
MEEIRNVYRILIGKSEGKVPLRKFIILIYLVKGTNCETPHYAVLLIPLLLSFS